MLSIQQRCHLTCRLVNHIQRASLSTGTNNSNNNKLAIHDAIDALVNSNPLVVFMKGTPSTPLCGFSRTVIQIIHLHRAASSIKAINVLTDEDMRQGVKAYSQWPTLPQVFIGGKFVGGCDTMLEANKSGELARLLSEAGIKKDAEQ
jgi:monothiol glutaredoxin